MLIFRGDLRLQCSCDSDLFYCECTENEERPALFHWLPGTGSVEVQSDNIHGKQFEYI